jgi:hypothetical protein
MHCPNTVGRKIIYLLRGKARKFRRRDRQEETMKVKGKLILTATGECLMTVPNITVVY